MRVLAVVFGLLANARDNPLCVPHAVGANAAAMVATGPVVLVPPARVNTPVCETVKKVLESFLSWSMSPVELAFIC